MDRKKIKSIVVEEVKKNLENSEIKNEVTSETSLFGAKSLIDSMGLVTLVVEIESRLLEDGYEISLMSESAMSRSKSPFRNVKTLTGFIEEQINEAK